MFLCCLILIVKKNQECEHRQLLERTLTVIGKNIDSIFWKSYYISNSFPHHYWITIMGAPNEMLSQNLIDDGVSLCVDESVTEKQIDERDNLDVAEDVADRFWIHYDEISAPNLELDPANDEQAHEPEAANDVERQL